MRCFFFFLRWCIWTWVTSPFDNIYLRVRIRIKTEHTREFSMTECFMWETYLARTIVSMERYRKADIYFDDKIIPLINQSFCEIILSYFSARWCGNASNDYLVYSKAEHLDAHFLPPSRALLPILTLLQELVRLEASFLLGHMFTEEIGALQVEKRHEFRLLDFA